MPLSDNVLTYLSEIEKIFFSSRWASSTRLHSLLTLLFIEVFDLLGIENNEKAPTDELHKYVQTIDQIINLEFDKKINLQYLADRLFLSTRQLARIIKKYYNLTLTEIITRKKLNVASVLLTNTNMSITEIISSVNFETPNYFYTLFKNHYGITPLQYRKKYQETNLPQ